MHWSRKQNFLKQQNLYIYIYIYLKGHPQPPERLYKWKRNTFLSHSNEKGGPLKHSKGNLSRRGSTRRHLTAISISLNFKELGELFSCHPAHSCVKSQTQHCDITLPVRQGRHSPLLRAQDGPHTSAGPAGSHHCLTHIYLHNSISCFLLPSPLPPCCCSTFIFRLKHTFSN